MKFEIVKESLLKRLADLNSIVDRKTTQPILNHVYLKASQNQLFLMTTDSEVTLQGLIPANVIEEGAITIPCDKFFQIVQRLDDETKIICTLNNEQFKIESGKSAFNLITLPAEDFPVAENVTHKTQIKLDASILFYLFNKVRFSIPNQDPRPYLNGLFLNVVEDGTKIDAVTSDGHRLSCAQAILNEKINDQTHLIIPEKAVNELVKHLNIDSIILEKQLEKSVCGSVDQMNELTKEIDLLKNIRKRAPLEQSKIFPREITLDIGEFELQVQLGHYTFITRLIDGNYPAYDQIALPSEDSPFLIKRDALLASLKRGKVLLTDKHDGIRLFFKGHELALNARNLENETAEELLEIVNSSDQNLETSLNINYLLDALSNIEGENIQMHFDDSLSPCLITSSEDLDIKYIIMPMRI